MEQTDVSAKYKRGGGSFVWKITLRQTLRTIGIFIWMNLMIALIFWGGLWFFAERFAAAQDVTYGSPLAGDIYTAQLISGEAEGLPLHNQLIRRLGLLPGGRRLSSDDGSIRFFVFGLSFEGSWQYTIFSPAGEGYVTRFDFSLDPFLTGFHYGMMAIFIFQLLTLLSGIFKISRSVRITLKPINQLAVAARQGLTAPKPVLDAELQLGSTIDALNAINENRLDTRIDVENEREELRGLAMAINSMLDRVDSAYRSQLRFVSDASHELRTPISVIQGYANLLDRWGKEDEKTLDESISAIKHESEQMRELIEQLLFLARGDNYSITLKMEWVDLTELVREVAKETELIDKAHKIHCPEREPLHILADIGLLKQALRILTDNAIKYTPEGGDITIDAKEANGFAAISVTDSGIGIAPDDLSKLFDRFFRADASRTRKTGGTGLGLSIAKWIVDSHGGEIEITSREGIGTRMTINLALASEASVSFVTSAIPEMIQTEP